MIFLDEIKDMKIYKKPFFAPINVDNKKKDSLVYLLTPNIESSKKLMTYPNMINRLYYQSYYLERNVNYFIKSSLLENADNSEEYLRSVNYIEEAMSSKERKKLSDSDFGLPAKRKYPIHNEKHVKSAIRFFNYVDKEDENELADNIIKQAKKFNMNISVGENNRLKKYLSEELSESYIKNDEDLYYNKDKFDRGEINLCFINGHMGSGKSTMGMDMLNNGIEWIELDAIIDNGYYTDEQAKNYSDLIYSFFKKYPKYRIATNSSLDEALRRNPYFVDDIVEDFVQYAIDYSSTHKNKKYVLEGIWIIDFIKPERLKDFAVYIKGTSALVSAIRMYKRNLKKDNKSSKLFKIFKNIGFDSKEILAFEKKLKVFRKYFEDISINEETIVTDTLNFSNCFNSYKIVDKKEDNPNWNEDQFYPTINIAIDNIQDRHSDKDYYVYTLTKIGPLYVGTIKLTFLDTQRIEHSWYDMIEELDKDLFYKEYPLNESNMNRPYVSYSGYKSDVEEFRDVFGKDFENNTNISGKYHIIIKDDLESCRIWISEDDTLNIELPSNRIFTKYYGEDYKTFVNYNILCGELIELNPACANTCLPYAVSSYITGIYKDGDKFDKSVWSIEYLLSNIEKDYGKKEIFDLVKNADIKRLYEYSRQYNIFIGSVEELRYDNNINEVSKDRRFNLEYFTRHIKYIGKKGKYKAHKIELDIKHNIEDNKAHNVINTAPKVADTTPSTTPAPTTDSGEESTSEAFYTSELDNINESLYIKTDDMVIFTEDAQYDPYLRRILFNDRLKQNKDVLLKYKKIKEELDIIKYTFTDIKRYTNKNLFVDLSYYNEVFFKNNQLKLDRGVNIYIELLYRLMNTKVFDSYTKKTVFIPINDWDLNPDTRMWFYRESINPISIIYRIMETTPTKLKDIFKDMDVVFLSNNRYFKINFSNDHDYNRLKLKFKMFINKLRSGMDVDDEDQDTTPDNKETKQSIVTNIVDKIETSTGVKLNQKSLTGKPTDTSDSEKITTNKDTDKVVVDKKKEELLDAIDKTADKAINTDDALDKMDEEKIKKLLVDLATQSGNTVKINNARASRMLKLQNDMLDIKINNMTIKDILDNSNNDKPIPETTIPVTVNKEQWENMKFINFGEDYDVNEDIIKILNKLSKVSRPISVRNIDVKDNSTSEDYIDLYTIDMEDYRGKRFKIKLDVPKFKSNSDYLILRGYKKTIQNQFFNMPIIKTEEDTCQIISNYNKIFVKRYGTVAGRSTIAAGKIIKAINKYKGRKTKIQFGNNKAICKKYELPLDYIDIAQVVNKIENDQFIFYFNQDEIREIYGSQIDYTKGLPFGYNKNDKEIMYYNGEWYNTTDNSNKETVGCPFSNILSNYLISLDDQFKELYDSAARSVKYTYSKCSIMSTEIPLVVVCAYSEGLSQVLKKAGVKYEIKEKLEKSDRTDSFAHIKFNDGYVVYQVDYNSSLLMNGLKDCDTESYSLADIDSRSMYLDFLDNFGGKVKADGLENFYDCMIDPITEEVLQHYSLPTDYVSVLLHANLLLSDNKYIKHTDTSSRRLRKQELIAVNVYRALFNDAYVTYANLLRRNSNSVMYSVKQSAVIDKFMADPTFSDLSVINCLNDIEAKNAITFKGVSGMNSDRAYSLDKRTYDDSMLNLLAMSTGFSGNVGITRQATVDMNIDGKRGYVKSIDSDTDKLSSTKTLSVTEALNPFGTTRDDPFRTAMTFIQTAKHAVRTKESDPLLVTNGSDEALPYMTSDIFAFKAKQDGKVIELDDKYMIVEYKDGTKDYINLEETIEKNSDGGFYVPLKLDKTDKLKVGSKFKAKDILAYDKSSFSNSLGENDNIAFNVGTLTKVAVICTDEGFEDSTIITSNMSERMSTDIIVCKDITLSKDTNVLSMISVGDHVEEGDTLLIISDSYDDETTNILIKNLVDDENEISELGRKRIKSSVTGKVAGIKIYRTVEVNEMSESLQKIVKKYEKPINAMKKKLDSNKILSSDLPATYILPATGKLKNAVDSVKIEVYLEVHDILSVGDKIVMDRANKGVIKDIIPSDQAPYTDFRPNEEVSVFANVSSFNNRMVVSPLIIGAINKLLIELDRSIKDILEIPYDDSKV